MSSYFEKLKRGMGSNGKIEEETQREEEKEIEVETKKEYKKEVKETPKEKSKINPARNRISNGGKLPEFKKVEIEVKPIISEPRKIKEELQEEKKSKWFGQEGQLTVDVYKTNDYLIIQSAIAGVKPEDLDVSIENDVLTIKGSREKTAEIEERDYFYQECYWGAFSRQIILPEEVDPSRTEAKMKEGILTIKIPRIERQKKRKIIIKE
jgi:HSP20 family protein